MFFAMLMNTNNYQTQFEYIGPFESEEQCEKMCLVLNLDRGYRENIRFIPQEMRGI